MMCTCLLVHISICCPTSCSGDDILMPLCLRCVHGSSPCITVAAWAVNLRLWTTCLPTVMDSGSDFTS